VGISATAEKPLVSLTKIVEDASSLEDHQKLPQLRKLMKAALKRLVEQRVLHAKKNSFRLTKRGSDLVRASPETSLSA
jgi:coproporphyrinogen III oxidase-like Fe-S oxidoreductase